MSRAVRVDGPEMLDALERGEGLRTVFQPIYELADEGKTGLHGYEALTRGPENTPYESPARLFERARRTGRETMLDLACARSAFLAAAGLPSPQRLFVNIQISSLVRDPDFVARLLADARRCGVDLKRLTVELIERHVLRPEKELLFALGMLRDAGVSIAVDDFGVGMATLELVIAFTPDYIKLDGTIARGIAEDRRRRIVVGSIVHMARQLHARVIAEGLEDAADVMTAARLGVALAQGRCLGREGPSPTATGLARLP
jgi:EAL domain-containing protein (putative c-di-GMP-specific phosphodiesterase class I)